MVSGLCVALFCLITRSLNKPLNLNALDGPALKTAGPRLPRVSSLRGSRRPRLGSFPGMGAGLLPPASFSKARGGHPGLCARSAIALPLAPGDFIFLYPSRLSTYTFNCPQSLHDSATRLTLYLSSPVPARPYAAPPPMSPQPGVSFPRATCMPSESRKSPMKEPR